MGQFLLTVDDANLQAKSDTETEADAVGANDSATANADEYADARAHIGAGSTITAATTLNVAAQADSVSTNSYSKTTVVAGVAHYDSEAGSDRIVTTEADLDPGSQLTAAYVSLAAAPAGGSYTVNADKTNISLNPDIGCTRETFGSNTGANVVNPQQQHRPGRQRPTQLERGRQRQDHRREWAHRHRRDQPAGARPDRRHRPDRCHGAIRGQHQHAARLGGRRDHQRLFASAFQANGSVMIQNAAPDNLILGSLDVVEAGGTPPISNIASHPNWSYMTSTAPGGGLVEVNDTNLAAGDIHLTGPITNPVGDTTIADSGGSVFADNAGAVIQTAAVNLTARGTLGTLTQPLPLQLVFTPGVATVLVGANGGAGVSLDVTPTLAERGPVQSAGQQHHCGKRRGQSQVRGRPGRRGSDARHHHRGQRQRRQRQHPHHRRHEQHHGQQRRPHQSGDQSARHDDHHHVGRRDQQRLGRPAHSRPHRDANGRRGRDRRGADIRIDLDPDQFNASAQGDIHVTAVGGPLIAGAVTSSAGNIVLTAGTANAGTEDLLLTPTSSISAAGGSVTLRAENNIVAAAGSVINSSGTVMIEGDYNSQNPAPARTCNCGASSTLRWSRCMAAISKTMSSRSLAATRRRRRSSSVPAATSSTSRRWRNRHRDRRRRQCRLQRRQPRAS